MKKAIAVLLSAVMMVTMLSSCCCIPSGALSGLTSNALIDSVKEYLLVGTWGSEMSPGAYMVLEKDGTGQLKNDTYSIDLEWYVEDDLLYMDISYMGFTQTVYDGVAFDVTFDTLTVTDGSTTFSFTKE